MTHLNAPAENTTADGPPAAAVPAAAKSVRSLPMQMFWGSAGVIVFSAFAAVMAEAFVPGASLVALLLIEVAIPLLLVSAVAAPLARYGPQSWRTSQTALVLYVLACVLALVATLVWRMEILSAVLPDAWDPMQKVHPGVAVFEMINGEMVQLEYVDGEWVLPDHIEPPSPRVEFIDGAWVLTD